MDTYKSITAAKMEYADDVAKRAAFLSTNAILIPERVQPILDIIDYLHCAFHSSKIIVDIHDLWSESFFRGGYRYGLSYDKRAKTHHLLKPYSEFTPEEKKLEDILGLADLNSMSTILYRRFPSLVPHSTDLPYLRSTSDTIQAIEVIGVLANDQDFVMPCAFFLHENWIEANRKMGITAKHDPRLAYTTEELLRSKDGKILLNNVRLDVLALALFVKREFRS